MSKVHGEAEELLDNLLRQRPDKGGPSLEEVDAAIERIEELSKMAQSDEDEEYLSSVAETLLGLRRSAPPQG